MARFNLKESIKRDYGFDLPISGGTGLSQDDPIIINTEDPLRAPNIQWRIIESINHAFKRAWLITNKKIFKDGDKLIEKVTTNVNYFKDEKPIRSVTEYYFDITSVLFQTVPNYTYFPTAYVDPESKIAIPFQISWLNFKEYFDNEPDSPGDGLTISYYCPSIKAHFYIYNKKFAKIDPKEDYDLIVNEFEESADQIDGEEIKSKLLNSIESENFLKRAYKVNEYDSFILFTTYNNYFFKLRLTKTNDVFSDEMTKHAIEQFILFMRLYQNQTLVN